MTPRESILQSRLLIWKENLTIRQNAHRFGISYFAAYQFAHKHHLKYAKAKSGRPGRNAQEWRRYKGMKKLREEKGWRLSRIARRYKCSRQNVSAVLGNRE